MFGVFGFWIMGIFVDLWPQVVGRAWHSTRMLTGHFWCTLVGLELMFVTLVAAGLVQGYSWRGLDHWALSVIASIPFWWVRTFSGLLIIVGTGLLFIDMWLTARQPIADVAPGTAPAEAA
jgi:cytochrome c oxidase cbb3-type subunit 1